MAFPGFSSLALQWLKDLKENNDRDWFQAHKATYEQDLKAPLLALVDSLNQRLAAELPEYHLDDPAKAPFRIYRDTRFSKDKTPYKTHLSATFPRRGLPDKGSGLYFQISAETVGIAAGSYMPPPDSLLAIRTRIAEQPEDFARIAKDRKLTKLLGVLQGEQLKRTPKGFLPGHPADDALRRKQFYYWVELDAALATTKRLESELLTRFQAAAPFLRFLDEAVLAARKTATRHSSFLR
ncbi:MAG: DUF2461 domain-containing protein [Bryobacterales bacterium]|jgi:uncharacterized protein (TIGR02453 family)|nr:DUF2461 domain-containing protein [Bryobacterales bacterium]